MVCLAKYFISEAIGDAGLSERASLATVIFFFFYTPRSAPAPVSTTIRLE